MRKYYVHDGQKEKGPFTMEELYSETLNKDTPVWYEGLASWTTAGNILELKELFDKKSTPPPFPQKLEKKETPAPVIPNRNEILDSFEDAPEVIPEPPKKSILVPIIIGLIIIGIVIAYFAFSN